MSDSAYGGKPPAQQHSDTSVAAAISVEDAIGIIESRVFDFIKRRGAKGATDQEIQDALKLAVNSEVPRRVALMHEGWVKDSGHRRENRSGRKAIVWIAVDLDEPMPAPGPSANPHSRRRYVGSSTARSP